MTKVHKQRQKMIHTMSNTKSPRPRIEFKSDALSATAWTEAYYASDAFQRGRKGITDTKPHKPVKLSYSRRAAEVVLGGVRDKIAHISEGLLGPEQSRGDNEQWIMDLAEVEAVFDEAIKKLAVEPVRTVTVQLTDAELDSIGLALRIAYDDQASYVQNCEERDPETKRVKSGQFRAIAGAASSLGLHGEEELWESLAGDWGLLAEHVMLEYCDVCGAALTHGQIGKCDHCEGKGS
jgi:hypothetical protein